MIKYSKLFIVLIAFSSCSGLPLYDYGYNTIKESFLKLDTVVVDEAYMRSSKYAFIRVRFGSSRSAILTLVREQNDVLEWISADDIHIFTFHGKIIKTLGLANDIEVLNYHKHSFNNTHNKNFSYLVNFYEPILLEQVAASYYIKKGLKEIKSPIEGRDKINTNLYEERIYMQSINWTRKNKYYVNKNNQIEKTVQYIHPFLNPVTIEYIKKYKGN